MTKILPKLPRLPELLDRKVYKTGMTRGASNREIFQNRVSRSSTVLIPWEVWEQCKRPNDDVGEYENGFIVLVNPEWYFTTSEADELLAREGLVLGENAVLLFQRPDQWEKYSLPENAPLPNGQPFKPPTSRTAPIGGTVIARIHSTTSANSKAIIWGFNEKNLRGAGIRVYEYASKKTVDKTQVQLEAYFWCSEGALEAVVAKGMNADDARQRQSVVLESARNEGLFDTAKLQNKRILDESSMCICPLCLERLRAEDFFKRESQAEGRETWDNTVTSISLFHIDELRMGSLQHKPYNLSWGHHHCNVVTKDVGIEPTLRWMETILRRNRDSGWHNYGSNKVSVEVSTSDEATETFSPDE